VKNLLKKKSYGAGLIAVFAILASLGPVAAYAKAENAKVKSECIVCHTDVNRIISLTSEIEQIRPQSGESTEASGEG
jgi:hypothetical protein